MSLVLADSWQIDSTSSRLGFTATLEGAAFEGVFTVFDGTIRFDPTSPGSSLFDVTVDVTSIHTGSSELDEGIALPEWFHASRFPRLLFRSSAVVVRDPSVYEVEGVLQVKSVKKTIHLPFRWSQDGDKARIDGEATLNRIHFDLGAGDWSDPGIVGHEVRVWAELHLVRIH